MFGILRRRFEFFRVGIFVVEIFKLAIIRAFRRSDAGGFQMIVDVEGYNLEFMFVQVRFLVSGESDVILYVTVDRYSDAYDRICKFVFVLNLGSKRYCLQILQYGSC